MTLVVQNVPSVVNRQNQHWVGRRGIINFRLQCDTFPCRLATGIPLKKGVPDPPQSMVRTPPLHLPGAILALKVSIKA
jgi:hypothetical protein